MLFFTRYSAAHLLQSPSSSVCVASHARHHVLCSQSVMRCLSAFASPVVLPARHGYSGTEASLCRGGRAASFVPPVRTARHVPAKRPSGLSHYTEPVAMAKQMEVEWNTVKVIENSEICEAHRYIVINVGVTGEVGSLCDSYRTPGMYVQIRSGEGAKPGYYSISCAPNLQGIFEFLIKDSERTQWLADLKAGDTVEMSPVMGKGFPITQKLDMFPYPAIPDDQVPSDILMFATGSGIAPIRAAIESRLNGINPVQRKNVKLYYGARYPDRMSYMDRFKLWESDGVEVIPVMSRPGDAKDTWSGRTGYIQDALKADGIANPSNTGVLLCGVKGMAEDVKTFCVEQGISEDRILTNF